MTAVSSISNAQYVQDALKYINGAEVTSSSIIDDAAGAIGAVPANAALMGSFYTLGRLFHGTDKEMFSIFNHTFHTPAGITGKGGLVKTTKNMFNVMTDKGINNLLTKGKGLEGAFQNTEIVDIVKSFSKQGLDEKQILKKFQDAKKAGGNYIETLQMQAKTISEPSFISKKTSKLIKWVSGKIPEGAKSWVKTNIGGIKLGSKTVGEAVKSGSGKFAKAFNTSGAGFFMMIDGVMALFTDVVPAFTQGGITEGLKQTGKSAVKVGASAAGWAVGATAGKSAGAWIGGAIGSIFPGAGTVIGAAIGSFIGDMVGGTIGSAIAGKVTEKVVGEDYTDKVQNEQIANQAAMIIQDSASMNELNQYVYAMVQEDMADDGKLSGDSKKMLEYLENGAGNVTGYSNLAFMGNTTDYNVSNPYQSTTTQNTSNDLNTLISRIQAGDTSVYDVPNDVLNKSAKSYVSASEDFANNYTNFGYTNPYAQNTQNTVYNYYAEA